MMSNPHLALQGYLERIQYPTVPAAATSNALPPPTLSKLSDIHRHHALHIPFENLSLVRISDPTPAILACMHAAFAAMTQH